ncbi:Hypothetical protein ORPV_725 [Orpheovirus IHUMI-LCC2]|uniref:Uncharacterized protein n=1 Tax=Orpheovirus IHUMI-LCC2 TaxID=2023057 RepID=A0A2I2L596_9VIRU|nr:Hypothetical protein ORPV_725 [Orpheovirus IHUMI-LCC2]SNW62629.1 Hypothetical protein ORPV_725 [Orpheovirus IHUMI-LCC2]
MTTIYVKDLLQNEEISNFTPQIPVLRLKNSNIIKMNDVKYEVRLFAFYLLEGINGVCTFGDFVRFHNIGDKELICFTGLKYIQPLNFSINDGSVYLNISILQCNV